jgi:hypothetical protein
MSSQAIWQHGVKRSVRQEEGLLKQRRCDLFDPILAIVLDDADLKAIEGRCQAASPGPWKAFVEGRDHWSGDDFIRVSDDDDEPDMYVHRATSEGLRPASSNDLDFIAAARQDVPRLLSQRFSGCEIHAESGPVGLEPTTRGDLVGVVADRQSVRLARELGPWWLWWSSSAAFRDAERWAGGGAADNDGR